MSLFGWLWRDTSNDSGLVQRVVVPAAPEWAVFMEHMVSCAACGFGQVRCPKAAKLWQTYRAARGPLSEHPEADA